MELGLNRGEGKDRRLIVETGEVNGLWKSQWRTIEKVLFSLASELELKEFQLDGAMCEWMIQRYSRCQIPGSNCEYRKLRWSWSIMW